MANLELIVLGSASGMPEPDRAHASLALRRDGRIWLLDAGEGVSASLLRWGLNLQEICEVYITHCHPDHCVGIFMILQYLHMKRCKQKVNIYLPGGAIPSFQAFMDQVYLVQGAINPDYELIALGERHQLADDLRLETYPTRHLEWWQGLRLPGLETRAFAFRVTMPAGSIFYSGDIKSVADIEPHLRLGDLLILEAAHIDLNDILETAQAAGVRYLLLTHAIPGTEEQLQDLLNRAGKYDLEVTLAHDGLKLTL